MTNPCAPTFLAQNPAISGLPSGWFLCVYAADAMGIDFDSCGSKRPSIGAVFNVSGDPSPRDGGNLDQAATAARHWGIDLEVHRKMDFEDAEERVERYGHAALVLVRYAPIRLTEYSGDVHFTANHAMLWTPGHTIDDPLRDGRPNSRGKGEIRYPRSLLRAAAGQLLVPIPRSTSMTTLGTGFVQIAFFPHGHRPAAPAARPIVHYRFGGQPRKRGWWKATLATRVHAAPSTSAEVTGHLRDGSWFHARQSTPPDGRAQRLHGSRVWVGNAAGTGWVHISHLEPVRR